MKGECGLMFKWDAMQEIGPQALKYQDRTVSGKVFEIELSSGEKVRVWRADNGEDYFCHGLTFGGKEAPGGIISPLSDHVPKILREQYQEISSADATPGD